MKHFKVKILENCLICQAPILEKRYRTFCSKKCREKNNNKNHSEYQKLWAQEHRGTYSPGKKQCLICHRYYIQVGTHIVQKHDMTARKYREEMGLPVKKGIVADWYKELKGKIALENGTFKNLEKGKEFWYTKNDSRAKEKYPWKGRRRKPDEYYG